MSATPPLELDWDLVLQPVTPESPCGIDMQYHPEYDAIRRARQTDQDNLPAGLWEREIKAVDWDGMSRKCFDLLAYRSKDLQVAAWLVEALTQRDRLVGYARGLSVFTDLVCMFWSNVFPLVEDGDAELRVRPINWLLQESLKWCDAGVLASASVQELGGQGIEQSIFWKKVESQLVRLEAHLEQEIPGHVVSFQAIRSIVRVRRLASTPQQDLSGIAAQQEGDFAAGGASVNSREMAYDKLREVANFLARTEPHSPVPTVLEALVAWRHSRFEDLLGRLPQEGGGSVYELLKLFKSGAGTSSN